MEARASRAAERAHRLRAEARAAGAEHHHVGEAPAPVLGNGLELGEIAPLGGKTQVRAETLVVLFAQPVERTREVRGHGRHVAAREAAPAELFGKAAVGQMLIGQNVDRHDTARERVAEGRFAALLTHQYEPCRAFRIKLLYP
jgi:hypothetical protein